MYLEPKHLVKDFKRQHAELRRLYDSAPNGEERAVILTAMDDLGKVFNASIATQPISIPVTPDEAKAFRAAQVASKLKSLTPTQRFDRGNSRHQAIAEQRERNGHIPRS